MVETAGWSRLLALPAAVTQLADKTSPVPTVAVSSTTTILVLVPNGGLNNAETPPAALAVRDPVKLVAGQ
jgi:hypothetical protein